MKHASLFSGIGGPEIAAAMMGWENVFHCEINPFGRAILDYWFPNSESYEDITKTDFTKYRGRIDVLTGGFPCQPFSYAGKRGGQTDERYLWPEMLRVIDEVRPTWVIGENVAGITTMVESCEIADMGGEASLFEEDNGVHRFGAEYTFTIERICRDLESKGYSVQSMLIPACAVGAPHRRDRVFIIAYNASDSDCRNDMRESGEHESKSRAQRIQERNEVRKPGESSDVRPEGWESTENSLRDGCLCGQTQEQGNQRDIRHTGPRDSERVCGEERVNTSDTDGRRRSEMDEHLQPKLTDGAESFGNGGKWDATDSKDLLINGGETRYGGDGVGQEVSQLGGRDSEDAPHTEIQRGERCGADDGVGGEEQEQSGRVGGESIARMLPGERWKGFPTVSPVHRGNDGLPFDVDDLAIPFAKWRNESLKAYGNAIVPQVMYRIFQCIEQLTI